MRIFSLSKNSFRNTIWVSNRLDPDQARHYAGPDLGPICLQWLWANDTSRQWVNETWRYKQEWGFSVYQKILSGIPSECLTDWIQIRPDVSSGLIWVQSVCKGYEQTTLVDNELIRPRDITFANVSSGLIWFQSVCKGYVQMTLVWDLEI